MFRAWKDGQAVRDGDWKLVKHGLDREWDLYRISVDPTEINSLADTNPEKVDELNQLFRAWQKEVTAADN